MLSSSALCPGEILHYGWKDVPCPWALTLLGKNATKPFGIICTLTDLSSSFNIRNFSLITFLAKKTNSLRPDSLLLGWGWTSCWVWASNWPHHGHSKPPHLTGYAGRCMASREVEFVIPQTQCWYGHTWNTSPSFGSLEFKNMENMEQGQQKATKMVGLRKDDLREEAEGAGL